MVCQGKCASQCVVHTLVDVCMGADAPVVICDIGGHTGIANCCGRAPLAGTDFGGLDLCPKRASEGNVVPDPQAHNLPVRARLRLARIAGNRPMPKGSPHRAGHPGRSAAPRQTTYGNPLNSKTRHREVPNGGDAVARTPCRGRPQPSR